MWERTRNKKTGTFGFTVWDEKGCVVACKHGFSTYSECDRAAEIAQREVLFGKVENDMTDDELLAALHDVE